ncbi:MAG TPA: GNAT family N-acetyltransferase [Chitinophagaceae bacterium]|nr:GNAT family N-acetyltransferase [Chitinophagaceae bacterium]
MKQLIAHISLLVDDYDKAIKYYTQQLSFILVEDTVLTETKRWVRVAPPGSAGPCLLLAKAANPEQLSRVGNQTGGRVFLFLHTDNFRRDYDEMTKKGISFIREPVEAPYGTVAVFSDLYGNLWDLIEPRMNENWPAMLFREALTSDISQIQLVRNSVKENTLSNPALVTDKDCEDYLERRGKGWVCEVNGEVVGFSIADLVDHNVWALFVRPGFDKKGIGKKLHDLMLDWYFSQTDHVIWLGTAPGTRAESFYRRAGWKETGVHGKTEIKFEMSRPDWLAIKMVF